MATNHCCWMYTTSGSCGEDSIHCSISFGCQAGYGICWDEAEGSGPQVDTPDPNPPSHYTPPTNSTDDGSDDDGDSPGTGDSDEPGGSDDGPPGWDSDLYALSSERRNGHRGRRWPSLRYQDDTNLILSLLYINFTHVCSVSAISYLMRLILSTWVVTSDCSWCLPIDR